MNKINKEIVEYDEWLRKRYAKRKDKDNIFLVGITDAEFREWVIRILLGDEWYVVSPLGQHQINEVALEEIIFRKFGIVRK